MRTKQTLADIAEAWHKGNGYAVPARGTVEWKVMYESWHGWAFSGFASEKNRKRGKVKGAA